MSPLSTNSLFHFTPSLQNLLGILENTFIPSYCYEDVSLLDPEEDSVNLAVPMVCFCDIPLSQIAGHMDTYGKYGIGMTKDWGAIKRLDPVIYIAKDSLVAQQFNILTNNLLFNVDEHGKGLRDILRRIKPYEGQLYRGGLPVSQKVRFYDEHEWRYVPDFQLMQRYNIEPFERVFNPEEVGGINALNRLHRSEFRLNFCPGDIRYLIVKDDAEISIIVDEVRKIKAQYNSHDVDVLTSRIITIDQILDDF
ncbi:MAG: hypothetical protein JXA51_02930 [Dehalococcoidales bacterium]|nr:hypothetical protein [Dehalococcoidales bacterium]